MSILKVLSFIWAHKPTSETMSSVEAIGAAAKQLIEAIESNLPEIEGRKAAIDQVTAAVTQANLVLGHSVMASAPSPDASGPAQSPS